MLQAAVLHSLRFNKGAEKWGDTHRGTVVGKCSNTSVPFPSQSTYT